MPRKAQAAATADPGAPMPFVEYGTSGINRYGGRLNEEFIVDLKGDRGRKVYREMAWNDATIAAILFVIRMLLRQAPLSVQAGGTSPQDILAHDLVETALDDMSLTWADTLSDICSMFPFGWAFLEVIYKHREGPDAADGSRRSAYTDGLIGWRKWALRSQLSLERWELDESGGVQAMVQRPSFGDDRRKASPGRQGMGLVIPIQKALLFKTDNAGGNPEGMSILRAAYKAYYFSKRIEMLEGIGIERDMAGMPEIKIPGKFLAANANPTDKAVGEAYMRMGEGIRNDKMSCAVLPSDRDADGNALYEFNLKGASGRRQFDTNKVLDRYALQKAMVVVADFIFIGHEQNGSRAVSMDKTELFGTALGAWQKSILAVPNRYEIPRLLALNGIRVEKPPQLVGGEIMAPSLQALGNLIGALAGAGMPLFPDDALENAIRKRLGAPPKEGSDPTTSKRRRAPKVGSAEWLAAKAGEFDEDAHPRHPEGRSDGGKFAPKTGGGEEGDAADDHSLTGLSHPLDAAEEASTTHYRGAGFMTINAHLRGTLPAALGKAGRDAVEGHVAALDQAIAKSTLREDTVVYRGTRHDGLTLARAKGLIGRTVSSPAFLSTSVHDSIANEFANYGDGVVYEIRLLKGARALDLSSIGHKGLAHQRELLLPRNARLRVTGVTMRHGRPVLQMEVAK